MTSDVIERRAVFVYEAARNALPRLLNLLDRCEQALAHAEPYCSVARAVLAELRTTPADETKPTEAR